MIKTATRRKKFTNTSFPLSFFGSTDFTSHLKDYQEGRVGKGSAEKEPLLRFLHRPLWSASEFTPGISREKEKDRRVKLNGR